MMQKYKPELYDSLCDKLIPYVRSASDSLPKYEPMKFEGSTPKERSYKDTIKLLCDKDTIEFLVMLLAINIKHVFSGDAFIKKAPVEPERLNDELIRIRTELIAASLSQTLEFYAEDNEDDVFRLKDCLLPNEIPGDCKDGWRGDIEQTGFSQEQVENLLRDFGREEIAYCLELPWGGYISRATNGYELRRLKK